MRADGHQASCPPLGAAQVRARLGGALLGSPDYADHEAHGCSPLRARGGLAGSAPAVVLAAYYDPLFDHAEEYVRALRRAGVPLGFTHTRARSSPQHCRPTTRTAAIWPCAEWPRAPRRRADVLQVLLRDARLLGRRDDRRGHAVAARNGGTAGQLAPGGRRGGEGLSVMACVRDCVSRRRCRPCFRFRSRNHLCVNDRVVPPPVARAENVCVNLGMRAHFLPWQLELTSSSPCCCASPTRCAFRRQPLRLAPRPSSARRRSTVPTAARRCCPQPPPCASCTAARHRWRQGTWRSRSTTARRRSS